MTGGGSRGSAPFGSGSVAEPQATNPETHPAATNIAVDTRRAQNLASAGRPVSGEVWRCVAPHADEEGVAALFVTHPPVGERVKRLRDLDPDWRDKLAA